MKKTKKVHWIQITDKERETVLIFVQFGLIDSLAKDLLMRNSYKGIMATELLTVLQCQ